jgi:outer membrane protein assembly factor BamB
MKTKRLPWFPLVTVILGLVALTYVNFQPDLDTNLKVWMYAVIPLLVVILNFIWFLLTPRFAWRTRLIGFAVVLLLGLGVRSLVTVDGVVNGTGLPRLAWKSQSKKSLLPSPVAEAASEIAATTSADPRLSQAADVTQFFGPNRDGLITGARLVRDWKSNPPKELWRQPIGQGWSAFAVVAGKAYTQEQRGEDEMVTCYDLFTGKLIWSHSDKAHFSQWQGGDGPRSTPSVVQGRVYTYGATGILNCLDAATGKPVWSRSVLTEHQLQNIEWGVSASPLIVADKVIVTGGATKGAVLFAYQRETGELLWKAGDDLATYSSPMAATLAGRQVVLSSNARGLSAHDLDTGAVLLDHTWGIEKWPKASQPIVLSGDRVFVSAGYGMGCQLLQIKAEAGGKFSASEIWTGLKMKTQFNSAVAYEDHVYGLDDGRLACVELATGERLWKEGRFGSGQSLLVDDLVLVQSESGPIFLAEARKEGYQELGQIPALSSKTWNYPTLAGRFLLARNDREVVCYELPVLP